MFLIASKMILCLVLAFLLGAVVGYLLCKMCKESECEAGGAPAQKVFDAKPKAVSKEEVTPDDLKRISGVGEKIEAALNGLGVYTFEQIANWNEDNIAWVDEHLVFKGRIKREGWVEQAKLLASGEETEFSKRFDDKKGK